MDYWEYLAHGQKGAERDDHRYYARELVGNRGGKNIYRYFYSAEEYASYRRSKGSHAGAAANEKESLLDKARKSHRENRWRPDMIISTGDSASVTYKNSAGKKRHMDYMGTDATRKAEREFNRKSDDNYEKNRDRMELVYKTDNAQTIKAQSTEAWNGYQAECKERCIGRKQSAEQAEKEECAFIFRLHGQKDQHVYTAFQLQQLQAHCRAARHGPQALGHCKSGGAGEERRKGVS